MLLDLSHRDLKKMREAFHMHTSLGWAAEGDARSRASLDPALKRAWASRGSGSAVAKGS